MMCVIVILKITYFEFVDILEKADQTVIINLLIIDYLLAYFLFYITKRTNRNATYRKEIWGFNFEKVES